LSKSFYKVVKKVAKSCQKVIKNSETGRRRRRRRFVVPGPGTTLSHLVKTGSGQEQGGIRFFPYVVKTRTE
jgi:hypothetical protein